MWFTSYILFSPDFLTPIAYFPSFKIVVLAPRALPTSFWELEGTFIFLPIYLLSTLFEAYCRCWLNCLFSWNRNNSNNFLLIFLQRISLNISWSEFLDFEDILILETLLNVWWGFFGKLRLLKSVIFVSINIKGFSLEIKCYLLLKLNLILSCMIKLSI